VQLQTAIKASTQIFAAGLVLVAVLFLARSPEDRSRPPLGLRSFAKFVRECVPPVRLQKWASNVVAQADQATNPAPIEVPVPPEFNWRIPAPCLPWRARILKPMGTNGPSVIELQSFSPGGGYGIVIGPPWFLDAYERSEPVTDGIYVRRYR
jgi:hypothetical protein